VRFEYVPILLGGLFKLSNNRSPAEAFADIPNKRAYDKLEVQRFIARHGLTGFRFNPHFPVNTLKIMRLAVAAQALGCGPQTIDAMYAAMWEQARNMDDPDEIAAVLREAGLDGHHFLRGRKTQRSRRDWRPTRSQHSSAAPSDHLRSTWATSCSLAKIA
jgi:2-hydroxychromene-2-carboxylate isomerase